jgi:hypothetical protein
MDGFRRTTHGQRKEGSKERKTGGEILGERRKLQSAKLLVELMNKLPFQSLFI